MAIVEITKDEFDAHGIHRGPMVGVVFEERAWFATSDQVLLGAITFDFQDQDWGYMILGRGEGGQFRGVDFEVSLPSIDEARNSLLDAMETLHAPGDDVFRQPEGRR